ncbi:MAG: ROK family protein [Butyricicoccaceae bacterium]
MSVFPCPAFSIGTRKRSSIPTRSVCAACRSRSSAAASPSPAASSTTRTPPDSPRSAAAKSLHSLVYLSLSNSVGGSIFHGRLALRREHLRAGEFGHMTLVPDGRPCYCGKARLRGRLLLRKGALPR